MGGTAPGWDGQARQRDSQPSALVGKPLPRLGQIGKLVDELLPARLTNKGI
jgi:hypothetical protein